MLRVLQAVCCAVVLLIAVPTYGQVTTGTFSGAVSDPNGATVLGATVTITNVATGVTVFTGTTDDQGLYLAPAIPVGIYNIVFEAPNFSKLEISRVNLQVDQRARVDATLQPGAVTETVTVVGENVGQLERESSSIDEVITTSQVRNLPLPNRNVLNLLNLVAGVSAGGSGTGIAQDQISINGSRVGNTEVNVDGVSVVQGGTGRLTRLPSAESLRELKVLTSAYSSEYGRTSGGFISAVVDSGTREFHGALYEYFRNEKLNANNFFNNARNVPRPLDRYNQFGFKLGGPLLFPRFGEGGPVFSTSRERTFFFFNYEGLRTSRPGSPLSTVPDERARVGDFSASSTVIRDPLTRNPFPGNRIPEDRIDPAARRILSLLPTPNQAGSVNNFLNQQTVQNSSDEVTARVDHTAFGSAARIFGRFTYYNNPGGAALNIPGVLNSNDPGSTDTDYQTAFGYTHSLSPSIVLEANAGFARETRVTVPTSLGLDVPAVLGINRAPSNVAPRINISGFTSLGTSPNANVSLATNTYQVSAAVSYVRGNNLAKFGTQLRFNGFDSFFPNNAYAGIYNFTGVFTSPNSTGGNSVNALADFLLGAVQSANYAIPQPSIGRRNYNLAFFVQDDWKVTPRLTLNLGLRYDYESPITVDNDIYSRIDPVTGRLLAAGRNASRSLNLEADRNNFGPRVGFAYSLNDRTVIRSAFGIFYSQVFSNLGGSANSPGFTVNRNFQAIVVNQVPRPQDFTLSQGFPLDLVQDLNDPFRIEREATLNNPLTTGASFGQISPLPYTIQYNFGIQRELPGGIIVDASYVGSRGVHLPLNLPFNQVPFERAEAVARSGSPVDVQLARQFPTVGGFSATVNAGTSRYNSLQLKAQRQFSRRLSFTTNYTFSKSIDDGSGLFANTQPNGLDIGQLPNQFRYLDRALSSFDRPHSFALAVQYTTPGPRFLRGFTLNPIFIARSGLPDTITQSNLIPGVAQQRPSVVGSTRDIYAPTLTPEGTAIRYLRAPTDPNFPLLPTGPFFVGQGAARRLVLPAALGTLGRNTIREPGEVNLDLAVARRIPITESAGFQLRAEFFNVLNHTNFNGPAGTNLPVIADANGNAVFDPRGFGLITSARSARFIQLVLRFEF